MILIVVLDLPSIDLDAVYCLLGLWCKIILLLSWPRFLFP